MHLFLATLAVLFVILGFVGFAYGGLPAVIFWFLAALCVFGAWSMRPAHQRRREERHLGGTPR